MNEEVNVAVSRISQRQATLEVVLACLFVFFWALFVQGCSTQPSILTELSTPAAPTGNISDATIISYWAKVADQYGMNINRDELMSTGGRLSLAALATATLAVAAKGGSATALAAATTGFLAWLGIVQPRERGMTFGLAQAKLREALGLYIVTRSGANPTIPTTCVSTAGGLLFLETMRTVSAAELTTIGLWPQDPSPMMERARADAMQRQAGCS